MDKKDSGVSIVILFVMILAVLGLAITTWALIGIPTQIEEAQFMHSLDLEDSFGDMQTSLESLMDESRTMYLFNKKYANDGGFMVSPYGMRNLTYSMLIPIGMQYFTGELQLQQNVGVFYKENISEGIPVDRLSVKFGDDSEIGYEGGGVFRRDGDTARWVIKPHLKQTIGPYGAPIYQLRIPSFDGSDMKLITNADVAIDFWYKGNLDEVDDDPYLTKYDVRYQSTESWDARLWYEFFYEAHGGSVSDITFDPANYYISGPISPTSISNIINMKYGIRLKSM